MPNAITNQMPCGVPESRKTWKVGVIGTKNVAILENGSPLFWKVAIRYNRIYIYVQIQIKYEDFLYSIFISDISR